MTQKNCRINLFLISKHSIWKLKNKFNVKKIIEQAKMCFKWNNLKGMDMHALHDCNVVTPSLSSWKKRRASRPRKHFWTPSIPCRTWSLAFSNAPIYIPLIRKTIKENKLISIKKRTITVSELCSLVQNSSKVSRFSSIDRTPFQLNVKIAFIP